MTQYGFHLYELYDMSIKEMLFELKYTREGKAYDYWKMGISCRVGFNAKNYPKTPKDLSPELYEKKKSVPMPEWLKDDYVEKLNKHRR